ARVEGEVALGAIDASSVADRDPRGAFVDAKARHPRRLGAPFAVAHKEGNGAQPLATAPGDITDVAAVEAEAERPAGEVPERRCRLLRAVEQEVPPAHALTFSSR